MKTITPLLASVLLMSCSATVKNQEVVNPEAEKLKQAFIEQQKQQGFTVEQTQAYLAKAKFNQNVLDAISRPWEAKPWYQYYPIFLTEKRLQAGLKFWQQNAKTIAKAAQKYQVDPQIIVAIIGIETFYGGYTGNYPVLDALYTLGFYYPPRADFFRSELGQFQTLIQEENLPMEELKGSYAGAMGLGQFISSSYRHYAVDFNQDGQRDLFHVDDAIGSVANYFHQHGWQYKQPVVLPLKNVSGQAPEAKVWKGEKLNYQVSDILTSNLTLPAKLDLSLSQPAMLIELEQEDGQMDYYLGLKNFYVITRYNRSPLYAMAVYEFSQALQQAYQPIK